MRVARAKGWEPAVLTESLHFDLPTADGRSLGHRLAEDGIDAIKLDRLDGERLAGLISPGTIGLLVNAVWMAKKDVIRLFDGRLFNYHNARLPEERGAAAYSWKILSGSRAGGITIHKVTERFDDGDIMIDHRFQFPDSCRVPADFYRFLAPMEPEFFAAFLDGIQANSLTPRKQDEALSVYWPRLNTDAHGAINWDWEVDAILRFVDAFDDPHPGASTFWSEKKIRLKGAALGTRDANLHPFQAGLVIGVSEKGVHVAARGGSIFVRDACDFEGRRLNDSIPLGARFFTPPEALRDSLVAKVVHRADGIAIKGASVKSPT